MWGEGEKTFEKVFSPSPTPPFPFSKLFILYSQWVGAFEVIASSRGARALFRKSVR